MNATVPTPFRTIREIETEARKVYEKGEKAGYRRGHNEGYRRGYGIAQLDAAQDYVRDKNLAMLAAFLVGVGSGVIVAVLATPVIAWWLA